MAVSAGNGGVLVIGGAGSLGEAAVNGLLEAGRPVRVLLDQQGPGASRSPLPAEAEVVRGSLDDRGDLDRVLGGIEALFVVLDQTDAGPSGRLRRGRAIGDAARQAGVRQIVYSGGTGSDHHLIACDQSQAIVDHLRTLELDLTVLRPVTMMEEIPWYWLSLMGREATLATPYEPGLQARPGEQRRRGRHGGPRHRGARTVRRNDTRGRRRQGEHGRGRRDPHARAAQAGAGH